MDLSRSSSLSESPSPTEVALLQAQVKRLQIVSEERLQTMQTLRESLSLVLEDKGVLRLVSKLQADRAGLDAQLAESHEIITNLKSQLSKLSNLPAMSSTNSTAHMSTQPLPDTHQPIEVQQGIEISANGSFELDRSPVLSQRQSQDQASSSSVEHHRERSSGFETAKERELFEQVQSLKSRVRNLESQVSEFTCVGEIHFIRDQMSY